MKYDVFGRAYATEHDLAQALYTNPDLDIARIPVVDPEQYNASIAQLHLDLAKLPRYEPSEQSLDEFDQSQQSNWYMPEEYRSFDIAQWVLGQCRTETELQRCGQELLMFQERNLFPLLNYLKYLVDTMREHAVVWGVGRGSSVASYVLYLIGVHRVNSIYYDLDIEEFLKG